MSSENKSKGVCGLIDHQQITELVRWKPCHSPGWHTCGWSLV